MKGIDTNILVRFLLGDDKLQAKLVYDLFKKTEAAKEDLFVSTLVVLELVWVLESVYGIKRKLILDAIQDLLLLPILTFEKHSALQDFLNLARQATAADLSDLLIAMIAQDSGCATVITFDKKAARSPCFELVSSV